MRHVDILIAIVALLVGAANFVFVGNTAVNLICALTVITVATKRCIEVAIDYWAARSA